MKIAIILPCYNEEKNIQQVIKAYQKDFCEADIYVIDNNSMDKTAQIAKQSGAIVLKEERQGKGYAIKKALLNIDADIYVLGDGDGECATECARPMVNYLIENSYEMVVGVRTGGEYQKGHKTGNRIFNSFVRSMFNRRTTDIFSGYRVLTKRLAKTISINAKGFELEADISIHCMVHDLSVGEYEVPYKTRLNGTTSKLQTIPDGIRILAYITRLIIEYKPLNFFSILALLFAIPGLVLGYQIIVQLMEMGKVIAVATSVLAGLLMLASFMSLIIGILLQFISKLRVETNKVLLQTYYQNINYGILSGSNRRKNG